MLQLIYQSIAMSYSVEKSFLERIWIILRLATSSTMLISQMVYVWCRFLKKSDFQTTYYVTNYCNILRQVVISKVIQTFKKLLKSESVNRSDLINSEYPWFNFSILLSCVFKTQTWLQIEIHIYKYCFFLLIFVLAF